MTTDRDAYALASQPTSQVRWSLINEQESDTMNVLGSDSIGYRLSDPVGTNTSEHPSQEGGGSKSVGYLQREPGRHHHIRSTSAAVVR